jgi:hypothetical protein
MELNSKSQVQPSVILTKATSSHHFSRPKKTFVEDDVVDKEPQNKIATITDASANTPSSDHASFMWPACECGDDDLDHFSKRQRLCGKQRDFTNGIDFGRRDLSLSSSVEDDLWKSLPVNSAETLLREERLSGVEGSYVVSAVGINQKGMVFLPDVIADLSGPVRADAYLPEYCFEGKIVYLKVVVDNRRNSSNEMVLEVMANAKFEFVGEQDKVSYLTQ